MRGPGTLLLLFSLGAVPAAALWLGPRVQAVWADSPPEIDGGRHGWTLDPEDDSRGVLYGAANDSRFLYLIVVPHTRWAREQLAGVYKQDLALWLDVQGGKRRTAGLRVLAPERLDQSWRAVETERLPADEDALVFVAPVNARGVLEARLPLSWLGSPPPKTFSLGLEAQVPRRPPAPPPRRGPRDGPDFGPPRFELFSLWLRLTLAEPAK